jgi:acetoin utilization protein AcuB
MLVKDWMSSDVKTIEASATLQDAINLMMENDISIVPVLDGGKLVGIVTDRDVKHASPSDACLLDFQNIMYHVGRLQINSIMTPNPITVAPTLTLEEAAETLLQNDISGLPVVDANGDLKGIITKNDVFRALIALSGLSRRGVLFAFRLPDEPGSIKKVTDVIRRHGGRLVSIVSSYETAPPGQRDVYVRAFNIERNDLSDLVTELMQKATLLYMVDHREDTRKFF